jgi:predicted dehydrogenase/threonine dehydrogenase-like Zn-dependent dehydrogenase
LKQVFFRRGAITVEEVPAPAPEAGAVLVRTAYSCLSPGTELAGVRASGKPLWARVMSEPENVRKVVDMVRARGLQETLRTVRSRVEEARPTGYSASGVVAAVGAGVADLRVGDRVACAGAQSAYHAEVIRVPRNLCVRVPDDLDMKSAASVTLGAIALQGVRRAQPTLGEMFAVIGLGLLGQLTVQLLKANGCRVIGLDVRADRLSLARSLGADGALESEDPDTLAAIYRASEGFGVDGAIITASSASDAVVSLAFRLCRKKGRVVLVGDVGLAINRGDIYEKELDFLVSTSYGPGRYDRRFEEDGLDYPIGYVRWTENRNMAEYLNLLAEGRVRVEGLLGAARPLEQSPSAYAELAGGQGPLASLIAYSPPADVVERRTVKIGPVAATASGRVQIALVGAGSFLKAGHLPALDSLRDRFAVRGVVSRTGYNAQETAKTVGAAYATTDYEAVLADDQVKAVLIATRHHLHADLALRALRAGKHVLVEKPLALMPEEVAAIRSFYDEKRADLAPVLLTGFNRRFSQYAVALRELVASAAQPPFLVYQVNAGPVGRDHWVHGPEGGGRNIGEACHFYDLFTYLTGSRIREVSAKAVGPRSEDLRKNENFAALITFDDGTLASLAYTAMGDAKAAKETLFAYADGAVLRLDDFRALVSSKREAPILKTARQEKGLREELLAFHAAVTGHAEWPIPLWQQLQAMEIAFRVERCLSE